MWPFYYASAAFIFGIMFTLGAIFMLSNHESSDKKCFIFEPMGGPEIYKKSESQRWTGRVFTFIGGVVSLGALVGAYGYEDRNKSDTKTV